MLSCADPPGPFPLKIQTYHINIVKLKLKLPKKASDHQPSPSFSRQTNCPTDSLKKSGSAHGYIKAELFSCCFVLFLFYSQWKGEVDVGLPGKITSCIMYMIQLIEIRSFDPLM